MLADSLASQAAILRSLADTLSLSDLATPDLSTAGEKSQNVADTLAIADAVALSRAIAQTQPTRSPSPTRCSPRRPGRELADTLAVADAVAVLLTPALPPGYIDFPGIGLITSRSVAPWSGLVRGRSPNEERSPRMTVVSFVRYQPPARFDALPWTEARIEESDEEEGTYTQIDTYTLSPVDADPTDPAYRSFTTELGTADDYWYRIVFADADGDTSVATLPIQNAAGVRSRSSPTRPRPSWRRSCR